MARAKRVSIALLAPGFALALLIPLLGVITMIVGGVILAIALEDDLAADEGGPGERRARAAARARVTATRP